MRVFLLVLTVLISVSCSDSSNTSGNNSDSEYFDTNNIDDTDYQTDFGSTDSNSDSNNAVDTDSNIDDTDSLIPSTDSILDSETDSSDQYVPDNTTPVGDLNLIPLPVSVTKGIGFLTLDKDAKIVVSEGSENVGALLASIICPSTGYKFYAVSKGRMRGDINLEIDNTLTDMNPEGYLLDITNDGVFIKALKPEGLFYGVMTLRELFNEKIESKTLISDIEWKLPKVHIEDYPRFKIRGFMLDVSRHFFNVETIKRYIDLIAYHKMNSLHLHLSDDQGWRIVIDSWPDLTLIGGSTCVGGGTGGFYTKSDFEEIVQYAESRYVNIIPEIDMPGHTNAALASYGNLNPDGEKQPLYTGIDVGLSSLWLGQTVTENFVKDVIGEIASMTPGPYIHIGGDEAHSTDHGDYLTFIEFVQGVVSDAGKTLIGWEDISGADLNTPFYAQHWHDENLSIEAVLKGAQIISSPAKTAYLDMKYDYSTPIGLTWAGTTDVEDAYNWNPVPLGISESSVAGIEAPLWTETVVNDDDIDYLSFPRLCGHGETGWSQQKDKIWDEYKVRLAYHGRRLDMLGVNYFKSPLVNWQ